MQYDFVIIIGLALLATLMTGISVGLRLGKHWQPEAGQPEKIQKRQE